MTIFGLCSLIFVCVCFGCALGGYIHLRHHASAAFLAWNTMLRESLKKKYAMRVAFEHPLIVLLIPDESNFLLRDIEILETIKQSSWRGFLKNCNELVVCLEQMESEMDRRLCLLTGLLQEKESEVGAARRFFVECLEDIWAADNLLSFHTFVFGTAVEDYNMYRNQLVLILGRELFRFRELCVANAF